MLHGFQGLKNWQRILKLANLSNYEEENYQWPLKNLFNQIIIFII